MLVFMGCNNIPNNGVIVEFENKKITALESTLIQSQKIILSVDGTST